MVLLIAAYQLPYMVEYVPGPGFVPLSLSFGILASGAVVTAKAMRGGFRPGEPIEWPDRPGWRQVGVAAMIPAGGHVSSVTDVARFMIMHLQGGLYGDASTTMRILEEATVQRMHRVSFSSDPRILGTALGFFDYTDNGQRTIGHSGGTLGFATTHPECAIAASGPRQPHRPTPSRKPLQPEVGPKIFVVVPGFVNRRTSRGQQVQ